MLILVWNTSLCLYLVVGIYILIKNPSNRLNQIFFGSTIILVIMCVIGIVMQFQNNLEAVAFLYKLGTYSFILYFTILVYFSIEETNIIKRKYLLVFFAPSILFIVLFHFKLQTVLEFKQVEDLWLVRLVSHPVWLVGYYVFVMAYVVFMTTLYSVWRKRSSSFKQKKQAGIFIAALSISFLLKVVDDVVVTRFVDYRVPGLPSIYLLVLTFGIGVSIVKYRYLSVTPEYVSNQIVGRIDEVVVLFDQDGTIATKNEKARRIIGEGQPGTDTLKSLFSGCDSFKSNIDNIMERKIEQFSQRTTLSNKDRKEIYGFSCSQIKDKYNDVVGFLMVGKKVKGVDDFKAASGITDREFDIVMNLAAGARNREIGRELSISLNTIKRHISNIYNKLGICNRVELLNTLKEYEIM